MRGLIRQLQKYPVYVDSDDVNDSESVSEQLMP